MLYVMLCFAKRASVILAISTKSDSTPPVGTGMRSPLSCGRLGLLFSFAEVVGIVATGVGTIIGMDVAVDTGCKTEKNGWRFLHRSFGFLLAEPIPLGT